MNVANISDNLVTSLEALEALYDAPGYVAFAKETDRVIAPYRAFIEAAPFLTLATGGPDGLDCSPRGDVPGFVRVHDERTLLIPDRAGNNRIDSLRNILRDPRIALLFLIPGCGETLRVNGSATVSADPRLAATFTVDGKAPRAVIVVAVERVFYQCAKAIRRSKLWDRSQQFDLARLPSPNAILAAIQWQRCRDAARPRRGRVAKTAAVLDDLSEPKVAAEPLA